MNVVSRVLTIGSAAVLVACSSAPRQKPIDPKSQNGRYLAACEVGDGGACFALGVNISQGTKRDGHDRLSAHKYFVAGCENGHAQSCEAQDKLIRDIARATDRALAPKT